MLLIYVQYCNGDSFIYVGFCVQLTESGEIRKKRLVAEAITLQTHTKLPNSVN